MPAAKDPPHHPPSPAATTRNKGYKVDVLQYNTFLAVPCFPPSSITSSTSLSFPFCLSLSIPCDAADFELARHSEEEAVVRSMSRAEAAMYPCRQQRSRCMQQMPPPRSPLRVQSQSAKGSSQHVSPGRWSYSSFQTTASSSRLTGAPSSSTAPTIHGIRRHQRQYRYQRRQC